MCWVCGRGFTDVSAHYSRMNLCGCPGLHMEGEYRDGMSNCSAQLKICARRVLLLLPMLPLVVLYYPLAILATPVALALRPACEDAEPAYIVLKKMYARPVRRVSRALPALVRAFPPTPRAPSRCRYVDPFEESCAGVKWTLLGIVCLPLLPLLPILCLVSFTCAKGKFDCCDEDGCCKGCNDSCDDGCSVAGVLAALVFFLCGLPLLILWFSLVLAFLCVIGPILLLLLPICKLTQLSSSVGDSCWERYKTVVEKLGMCACAPIWMMAFAMHSDDD